MKPKLPKIIGVQPTEYDLKALDTVKRKYNLLTNSEALRFALKQTSESIQEVDSKVDKEC